MERERDEAVKKRMIAEGLAGLTAFEIDGHSAMIALARDQVSKRMTAEANLEKAVTALREMHKKSVWLRGEQSYREFARYAEKTSRTVLAELEGKE